MRFRVVEVWSASFVPGRACLRASGWIVGRSSSDIGGSETSWSNGGGGLGSRGGMSMSFC